MYSALTMTKTDTTTYRLRVTSWENEDEYGDGGNLETRDRYFGPLSEVLSRQPTPDRRLKMDSRRHSGAGIG